MSMIPFLFITVALCGSALFTQCGGFKTCLSALWQRFLNECLVCENNKGVNVFVFLHVWL